MFMYPCTVHVAGSMDVLYHLCSWGDWKWTACENTDDMPYWNMPTSICNPVCTGSICVDMYIRTCTNEDSRWILRKFWFSNHWKGPQFISVWCRNPRIQKKKVILMASYPWSVGCQQCLLKKGLLQLNPYFIMLGHMQKWMLKNTWKESNSVELNRNGRFTYHDIRKCSNMFYCWYLFLYW